MPESFSVRPSDLASDLDDAAAMLAARHRRDRLRFPILPERFEDAAETRRSLQETASFAQGVAAIDADGRLAGFLFAIRILPAPTSAAARFATPRSTMMFAHGHAAGPGSDAYAVYHALYAAISREWVRDGLFHHVAHVPRGSAEEPWFELGFGRSRAVAARDLLPLDDAVISSRVEVRLAGPDDVASVLGVCNSGTAFHTRSPVFSPDTHRETDRALREELDKAVADETQAIFLARSEGQDAGMLWIGPGRGSPMFTPDRSAYIGDTAVVEQSRRSGVGGALLQAALSWALEREYRHVTLHFATANAVSRSFWTGHGFEPVMYHVERRIDERILWAGEAYAPA
jgi:GNAT superfamily N-acetyltransferase